MKYLSGLQMIWKQSTWYVMGYWTPRKKLPKKTVTPPSSKIIYLPQSSNFLLPPPTGNKKHEDVKLMHKPFIQHNCEQIKKNKMKSEEIQQT